MKTLKILFAKAALTLTTMSVHTRLSALILSINLNYFQKR